MNENNLIPFSKRSEKEARELGSKGGKASGKVRSFQSALKRKLKDNPGLFDEIINMLTDETLDGNLKAAEMLLDLAGESVQRENLKLRREELKLKKQQITGGSDSENITIIDDLKE